MSYITVKLLRGLEHTLLYQVPAEWEQHHLIGSLVWVPLKQRKELALITAYSHDLATKPSFSIKQAHALESLPDDSHYSRFIQKISAYYALESRTFYKRLRSFLNQKETVPVLFDAQPFQRSGSTVLTDEQQLVADFLRVSIQKSQYTPTLLQGVTGSGKTEVYKAAIEQAIHTDKSALFLVPEVSLAVQFTKFFQAHFQDQVPVFGFHSASSVKEKRALWQHLMNNKGPYVLVGVHLPLLLPLPRLGLIIVDEEHDMGYQEKKYPRINSKEIALIRAQLADIPILLGSATPSLTSLFLSNQKKYHFFQLKNRFSGAFPKITIIKLKTEQTRKNFWISNELHEAIKECLARKEQAIIFLNRRGFSFFIQCKSCHYVPHCTACSVTLTLHEDGILRCHYCTFYQPNPTACTNCTAGKLLKKGIGTQQLTAILSELFPDARIGRADSDSTINKKKWQATLQDFYDQNLDILVGTQTITKGYHFPHVTLVGVVWADLNLHFPTYHAAETTLQQLIQVAGRAGRYHAESKVILQTMLDHPIFNYLSESEYHKFYDYELEHRQTLSYPPCSRFAEIELRNTDETLLEAEADRCAIFLESLIEKNRWPVTLLGPTLPPVHRVQHINIRKIYLKSSTMSSLITLYQALRANTTIVSSVFFTPNPL
jgi:primosomal protein N' (replication factor Y)